MNNKNYSMPDQIYKEIVKLIRDGIFDIEEKLPAEVNLAKQLNTSRTTLRDALRSLEKDGYIVRKHGAGTFVVSRTPVSLEAGLEKLESITAFIRSQGSKPGTKKKNIIKRKPDQSLSDEFNIDESEEIIQFERIRLADDQPFAYDIAYGLATTINEDFIENYDKESIFEYLEEEKNIIITHSYCEMYAKNANKNLAEALDIPINSSLQVLKQVYYSKNKEVVFVGESYIRNDILKFHLIRKR